MARPIELQNNDGWVMVDRRCNNANCGTHYGMTDLTESMAKYPNIKPGEEFNGYK